MKRVTVFPLVALSLYLETTIEKATCTHAAHKTPVAARVETPREVLQHNERNPLYEEIADVTIRT